MHLSQLILNNSIRLTERILLPSVVKKSSRQIALSDTIDDWITKQSTLIKVAKDKQLKTDYHGISQNTWSILTFCSRLLLAVVTNYFLATEAPIK